MNHFYVVIGVVVILCSFFLGLRLTATSEQPRVASIAKSATETATRVRPPTSAARRSNDHPSNSAARDWHLWQTQSDAGDLVAKRKLALALMQCNGYVPVSRAALEDAVVEVAAHGGLDSPNGSAMSPDEYLHRLDLVREERDRQCSGIEGLNEPDAMARSFQLIAEAAQMGDADAQAYYGSMAFAEFGDRSALANAEAIRDRKLLATEYLNASMRQGDPLALFEMASHYVAGDLYPKDDLQQYEYLLAYSFVLRPTDISPDLLQVFLAEAAAKLSAEQIASATPRARELAQCCEGRAQ